MGAGGEQTLGPAAREPPGVRRSDMDMYTVALDLASALAAPQRCPRCGGDELEATGLGGRADLTCAACGVLWAYRLGMLLALDHEPTADGATP